MTILGCGSATPTLRHFPSSQLVRYGQRLMLVDCGEGTQLQLRRYGISFAKISDIFISHLHGDHFLGLPGLLSTMALHNVPTPVTVHVSREGEEILRRIMNVFCRECSFPLFYNVLDPAVPTVALETKTLTVSTFPLHHRVPCNGFIFREKPKQRHIDGAAALFHGVPHYLMNDIRAGADFVKEDGQVIPNSYLTKAPDPEASYAYCSDTAFSPDIAEAVRGVNVLYHEATYGQEDEYKAAPRGHSTAVQAARTALEAGAEKLIIGHYSKVIHDEEALADQARTIFPNTIAAREGLVVDIP